MEITFTLNSREVVITEDPLRRLLDVLRDDFGLKGVKGGCGEGVCGVCAVLLNGMVVNSCLIPVGMVEGCQVETIEGCRESERFREVSEAIAREGAVQCGYCTPGIMITIESLIRNDTDLSGSTIREALSGNLCRCTGYNMIINAVESILEKKAP